MTDDRDALARQVLPVPDRVHPRALAFWDNHTTMHFGIFGYEGMRRVMHRVTLRGDRPIGPTG